MDFYEKSKVYYCKNVSPAIQLREPNANSGFSSDFRTFGSTDPKRPLRRESGKGMTKTNGIEISIFDMT